jgi:RND family efflux transporter MFP subunit
MLLALLRPRPAYSISTLSLLVLVMLSCLVGCGGKHDAADASKTERPLPTFKAEVITVEPRPWPLTVRAHGSLIGDEVAVVGAKVAGRVAEVHVDLGDAVTKGDPLVTLDQEEFRLEISQMEAQLGQACAAVGLKMGDSVEKLNPEKAPPVRQAKALWDEAKTNLVRVRQLLSQTATSESEHERIATAERVAESQHASSMNAVNEKIAEIRVRSAELDIARQRLEEAIVRAPFDGLVEQRRVAQGSFVQVGQAIATVVSTNRLRFRATMSERLAHQLAVGREVRLHLESGKKPRVVTVSRISPAVDELSRALVFEADVDNADNQLRSGLFAEAEVVLDPEARALVVPASAVAEFAGVDKVWKVVNGLTEEQVVRTGQRRDEGIQIISGLTGGESILRNAQEGRVGRVEELAERKTPSSESPEVESAKRNGAGDESTPSPVSTE